MAADDVDGQNYAAACRWRWLDAARYVVALAVTALMVTVIVHAVNVLLRPDDLFLRVDKGFVAVDRGAHDPKWNLSFSLDLEVANPSGRVVIYYEDVNAYLYGRANNASKPTYFVSMIVGNMSVKQDSTKFGYLRAHADLSTPAYKPYVDLFNGGGGKGIPDGVVMVNGTLTVGVYSWHNETRKQATYYCWPVVIGGDSPDDTGAGTQCTDNPPTPDADINAPPS